MCNYIANVFLNVSNAKRAWKLVTEGTNKRYVIKNK